MIRREFQKSIRAARTNDNSFRPARVPKMGPLGFVRFYALLLSAGLLAAALSSCASRPPEPEPLVDAPEELKLLEPVLTVRSIVLVRHELVNVLLELILDVENPNAFPVEFSAAHYRFHGEGRKWGSGTADRSVPIPSGSKTEIRLPLLLNFTETGRDLFDLVAKLQTVRYRLEGRATVSTPMPFLPEFQMDFDRTGTVRVERTLPARP